MIAEPPLHFFFYGTLIAGSGNAAAQAAHAWLRPIGPATVPGTLWAIPDTAGWYPALVAGPMPTGQGQAGQAQTGQAQTGVCRVHGMLYAAVAGFGPDDLARLDAWEDYRPRQPAESLYLRTETQVADTGGASVTAQVYFFNQPLPDDARAIIGGDFQAWLKATGFAAYAG